MSTLAALPNIAETLTHTSVEFTEQDFANHVEDDTPLTEDEQEMWDYYEREVLKAINNGKSVPYTPDFWDTLRKEAHERREARKMTMTVRDQ